MSGSKRAAGRELNHDNWNDVEEDEDAGEFKKATEDELQKRVRKIAKRRIGDNSENVPNANPFSGFGGFKGITTSTPAVTSSPFSFLAKIPSATAIPKTNGATSTMTQKDKPQVDYLSKLKALNVAVADWIKTNVDKDPLCILSPIFKDYEKYLSDLEKLKEVKKPEEKSDPKPPAISQPTVSQPATFSFDKPSVPASTTISSPPAKPVTSSLGSNSVFKSFAFSADSSAQSTPKPGISFGSLNSQPSTIAPAFSFGLQNPLTNSSANLFSTSTPFSFGNVQPPKSDVAKETTEEEADEAPPKNEFVPVVEDDSLFSKRCKVFVKGGEEFADRGVGTLFIKKVDDGKIQMIVRADTNLGNILLNIMIVEGLPVSRMGKNNVMVVCIPTPDAKPPPTSVLLRVKTAEEADELLNMINKYKK